MTADATINSISFDNTGTSTAMLTVNSAVTLTVTAGISLRNSASANTAATITGAGTINCASFTVGGSTIPTANSIYTTTLTSTITDLSTSGNLTITSQRGSSASRINNATFALSSGSVSVGGTVTLATGSNSGPTATLDMTTGLGNGTLTLSGSTPITATGSGTETFNANGTTSSVIYSGAAQTVYPVIYRNLTLSGSGAKILTSVSTVNGNLTLSGTASATLATNLTVGGNLDIGSGTMLDVSSSNYDLIVNGNWTNNGSFNARSGEVTFSGGTQTIGGSATATFNNVLVKSGAILIPAASVSINAGTIQLGDTVSGGGSGTLSFSSGSTVTATNVILGGSTSTSSRWGAIDMTTGGTLKVSNLLQLLSFGSNGSASWKPGIGTIEFSRTGAQTIPVQESYNGIVIQYNNLTTSGSGTKSLGGALTVNGNLTIGSGTTLDVSASNYGLTVKGDWTNSGTFNARSGTVTLSGSSAQAMSGDMTFYNLALSNSSGLTINANETVNHTLTLTSGNITTGENTMIIGSCGTVSRTSGHVVGNLQKNVATGATSRTFEVGTASAYNPVTIAFGSVTTAGNLTAKVTPGQHPNIGTSTINSSKDVNEYWSLTNLGIAFNNYSATFTFVSGDILGGANTANFIVGKYNGGWTYPTVGTKTSTSTQATGMTSLSDFVLGEASVPGIIVSPTSGLVTTEAGGQATFTIKLNSQLTANVTIGLSSSDTSEGTVSSSSVTFTSSCWSTPQTVTITGADDCIVDGNVPYNIVTEAATSGDGNYNGLDASDVSVTNNDDDTDADADGYTVCQGDCDDNDANEHPNQTWYKDADNDGYSDGTTDTTSCTRPTGYNVVSELTATSGDCNDNDASVYPGATEICGDGIDQDCSGADLSCDDVDNDGDGYTENQGDCNDNDATIHPGATEICGDGIDQDCSGDDLSCNDVDNDGDGYTENQGDCDDNDANEHPNQTWYKDADNDGYSDGTTDTTSCTRPTGYKVFSELTATSGDCDDNDPAVNPGAMEVPYNGKDDDCNAATPDYYTAGITAGAISGQTTPTITWANPADIVYGTPLSNIQLNATASVPGTFVYTPAMGTVLNTGAGQTLRVDFTPTDTANYSSTFKNVTINVLKAMPVITWDSPADIVYGTPLSSVQLNATASVPGTFVYTPAMGTVLNAGAGQTLRVDFTPTDTANYSSAFKNVTINVFKAMPVITWDSPADIVYGTPLSSVQLNATASVPGTFVYTPAMGTVLNVGAGQTLRVDFTPADTANYSSTFKNVTINVLRATPAFSNLSSPTITYGDTPTSLGGKIASGALVPSGNVSITLNGVTQLVAIDPSTGNFSSSFATDALVMASSPYNITYIYAGDANFNSLTDTSESLMVTVASTIAPPTVLSISPADGATGVPTDTAVSITFSVPMDRASVERAFAIAPTVSGTFNWVDNRLTFTPDTRLSHSTTYTVTVSTEAKNTAGTGLEALFEASFRTGVGPAAWPLISGIVIALLVVLGTLAAYLSIGGKRRRSRSGEG